MSTIDVQNINSKTGNSAISIADAGDVTSGTFTSTATITATSFNVGLWEIKLDTQDLRFVYDGTDVFKITTTGDVIALGNVTAYGTP